MQLTKTSQTTKTKTILMTAALTGLLASATLAAPPALPSNVEDSVIRLGKTLPILVTTPRVPALPELPGIQAQPALRECISLELRAVKATHPSHSRVSVLVEHACHGGFAQGGTAKLLVDGALIASAPLDVDGRLHLSGLVTRPLPSLRRAEVLVVGERILDFHGTSTTMPVDIHQTWDLKSGRSR